MSYDIYVATSTNSLLQCFVFLSLSHCFSFIESKLHFPLSDTKVLYILQMGEGRRGLMVPEKMRRFIHQMEAVLI